MTQLSNEQQKREVARALFQAQAEAEGAEYIFFSLLTFSCTYAQIFNPSNFTFFSCPET